VALEQPRATGGGEPIHELVDERGQHFPLVGERLVAGRSAQCDIRLSDELASRSHFQLQRTPAGWQIEDLGSTNGTLLNGRRLPPGAPVPVALSDRITVGHTTFVMQRSAVSYQSSANQRMAVPPRPGPRTGPGQPSIVNRKSSIPAWQWLLAALVVAAAALLVYGASQPWVRVEVQLTFEKVPGGELLTEGLSLLDGLLQDVLKKPPLATANAHDISGKDSYGWFTRLAGFAAALMAVLDLALRLKRSVAPGIAYLLAALLPAVVLAGSIQQFMRLGAIPILFGVDLLDIFQGASKIMQPKVTPLTGLYMTATGLALLLGAGVVRSILPALTRRSGPTSPVP
jgi:pSer/pThr/pTyr-binding forkhead associated (FHA) protein